MKVLETRETVEGVKVLAELSVNETLLIQRAMTAPIKRKVKAMTPALESLKASIQDAINFNNDFVATFYGGHKPKAKKVKKQVKK